MGIHQSLTPLTKRTIDEGAMRVHGITNEFVADKRCFRDVVKEFKKFIEGAELIIHIHNAPFDIGFLDYELSLLEDRWIAVRYHCKVIDTLAMARDKHPGQRKNLDALCRRYEINNQHREFHRALLDASILAEVYLAMTGGQGTLFSFEADQQGQQQLGHQRLASTIKGLRVVSATTEESLLHDNFLRQMEKKQ